MIHLGELASAYLDGEVTPAESERVRTHLDSCQVCAREMSDLHVARSALRALPTLEVPVAVFAELGLVDGVVPIRRRAVTWVAAAAAAAAIFVGTAVVAAPDPIGLPLDDVAQLHVQHDPLTPRLTPSGGVVMELGERSE